MKHCFIRAADNDKKQQLESTFSVENVTCACYLTLMCFVLQGGCNGVLNGCYVVWGICYHVMGGSMGGRCCYFVARMIVMVF